MKPPVLKTGVHSVDRGFESRPLRQTNQYIAAIRSGGSRTSVCLNCAHSVPVASQFFLNTTTLVAFSKFFAYRDLLRAASFKSSSLTML